MMNNHHGRRKLPDDHIERISINELFKHYLKIIEHTGINV